MIAPQPFKYKCPKCGFSKIVKPKSDALSPIDMMRTCSKCQSEMERVTLNVVDRIGIKLNF